MSFLQARFRTYDMRNVFHFDFNMRDTQGKRGAHVQMGLLCCPEGEMLLVKPLRQNDLKSKLPPV